MDSIEDLIGAEVTDALDGSWLELTLPDGSKVTVVASHTHVGLVMIDEVPA